MLSRYHIPDTILEAGCVDIAPEFMELIFHCGRQIINKPTNEWISNYKSKYSEELMENNGEYYFGIMITDDGEI